MLRLAFLAHTDALGAGNAVRHKGQIHVVSCPSCHVHLEVSLEVREVRVCDKTHVK